MRSIKVGDKVVDDLTNALVIVSAILVDNNGNVGYKVSHCYLDGLRYGWEITEIAGNDEL